MNQSKKLTISAAAAAVVAAATLFSSTAYGGFTEIPSRAAPAHSAKAALLEEGRNAALNAELDRLAAELAVVKKQLETQRSDTAEARKALAEAITKLGLLEQRYEKITVAFTFGSTAFSPQEDVLAQLIDFAKSARRISIKGFTDNQGPEATNKRVALQRAVAAKQFLIGKGIKSAKINVSGRLGEYVSSNDTDAGRAANRRVEIEFTK